ncbi:MAG TPA: copper chaperone PCu(A)C [Anaerolineales bacterium]|nr:copper chaperone PCu(A)C [Anaerolineales bacterium]
MTPRRIDRRFLFGLAASLALVSCAPAPPAGLEASEAWTRPADVGGTSAVYLSLTNNTETPDRLLGADSSAAAVVEIHETMVEGDMAHMMPVDSIDLPPGEKVILDPGGFHLMLVGVTQALAPGDRVSLTLHFERAGEVMLEAEVRAP